MGAVVNMSDFREPEIDPATPWGALGFATERAMLLDDLVDVQKRLKANQDTGTAIKALRVEKREILAAIKELDSSENDPSDILDDAEDEAWSPDDAQ